jgi:predicted RNA-binding Zn-ribbon protein involved in translation (DUF1610 family)
VECRQKQPSTSERTFIISKNARQIIRATKLYQESAKNFTRGMLLPAGSLCPQCKIGHIYPTGKRQFSSEWNHSEHEGEYTEFTCDKCGQIVRELTVRDRAQAEDSAAVGIPS